MFSESYAGIMQHLKKGAWYLDANMFSGAVGWTVFSSLATFWPGVQVSSPAPFRGLVASDGCRSRLNRVGFCSLLLNAPLLLVIERTAVLSLNAPRAGPGRRHRTSGADAARGALALAALRRHPRGLQPQDREAAPGNVTTADPARFLSARHPTARARLASLPAAILAPTASDFPRSGR